MTTIITLVTGGMCECLFRVLAFAILWITQVLQKINHLSHICDLDLAQSSGR